MYMYTEGRSQSRGPVTVPRNDVLTNYDVESLKVSHKGMNKQFHLLSITYRKKPLVVAALQQVRCRG